MNRNLIICRHAEAANPVGRTIDFDRPLTSGGLAQARQAGHWLKEQKWAVNSFLSSPARRARETAETLAACLGWPGSAIRYEKSAYNAPAANWVELLRSLGSAVQNVILVGHNPGVSVLSGHLCGKERLYLDTGNLVIIRINLVNWEEIEYETGTLAAVFRPS